MAKNIGIMYVPILIYELTVETGSGRIKGLENGINLIP